MENTMVIKLTQTYSYQNTVDSLHRFCPQCGVLTPKLSGGYATKRNTGYFKRICRGFSAFRSICSKYRKSRKKWDIRQLDNTNLALLR